MVIFSCVCNDHYGNYCKKTLPLSHSLDKGSVLFSFAIMKFCANPHNICDGVSVFGKIGMDAGIFRILFKKNHPLTLF